MNHTILIGGLSVSLIILFCICVYLYRSRKSVDLVLSKTREHNKTEINVLLNSIEQTDKKHRDALIAAQKSPAPTQTAEQLLQDLLSDGAIVVTQVVDRNSVFLWGNKK